MTDALTLIVGLGNPGNQYQDTRHNAGKWFVDQLAREAGASLRPDTKFKGELCKTNIAGRPVWLLTPSTYMNLSGQSVAPLARFYKIEPQQILVAHDELDFDPGHVRIKKGGGAGGHNGLTDISQRLGSKDYLRLRIGIGHPGSASQVSSYVLKKPSLADRDLIERSIDDACRQINDLVQGNITDAMNALHASPPKPKKKKQSDINNTGDDKSNSEQNHETK